MQMKNRPWFQHWPKGVPLHISYPEITLGKMLTETATKYPDHTAFICRSESLTYSELDRLTASLAAGMNDLGVGPGDRIVLVLPNSLEYVITYYGALKAGCIISPANPLYGEEELKHHLNDSGATAIIIDSSFYPKVRNIRDKTGLKLVILTTQEGTELSLKNILDKYSPAPPAVAIFPKEDVAAIEYTGGTTGLPKGVMLTHYNLVANAIQNTAWFNWSSLDVIMGLLPFYHSWGASACVNSPIYAGARVVITPRFDVREVLSTIEQKKVTVFYGAASVFNMLSSSPLITEYDLSSLRYVKAGAMPIPQEVKQRWEQITGVPMVLGYGLSEASPETHNSPVNRVKPGTIGIPIIDTDARIMDEPTGTIELGTGEVGELVVKGPQVMKGYLNRPEDNAMTLRDGWLYTGDLAFMDEEGYFHIVDRKKETIKYKGYTIAPAEIESVLYGHPSVKECAVVGKPDAVAGELPKAFVVLHDGCTVNPEELIEFCRQKVAPYKKIREIEFIDKIPKTPVGKILRRILRDREKKPH